MKAIFDGLIYGLALKAFRSKRYQRASRLFLRLEGRSGGANYHLGLISFYGFGRDVDCSCALRFFVRSNELCYYDSIFYIGWCHEKLKDYSSAAAWYERLLEVGDVRAIFRLALLVSHARISRPSEGYLESLLLKGVRLNDASCECLLAEYYLRKGEDLGVVIRLLSKASAQGLIRAEKILETITR